MTILPTLMLLVSAAMSSPPPVTVVPRVAAPLAPATPADVANALLETDRKFALQAARGDVLSVLSSMFADGVVTPTNGGLMIGREKIIGAMRASPEVVGARATWTPIRVGISADGEHGFTFGFFTLIKTDGTRVPQKYMAYWQKIGSDWRVTAYKRSRASGPPTDTTMMPPALPAKLIAPVRDAAVISRLRRQLMESEAGFSNDAQRIGLGNAFLAFGTADAVNTGGSGSSKFIVGNKAIAEMVARGNMKLSQVHWGADTAFVSSSGDLGITFGVIRANRVKPGTDPNAGSPFFTIWRRAEIRSPWRYVAE